MRLPILQAFLDEFNAMTERGGTVVRNDVVLQLVRDSFDMLVIDLASLCEGLTKGGFFVSLKVHAGLLRRFAPDDVDDSVLWAGETPSDEYHWQRLHREDMARRWNEVFDRLFPDVQQATEADVEALIRRFRKSVEPTDRDRNRVRAYQFERHVDGKYFQDLASVSAQIDVVDGYLSDLLLVLVRGSYSTEVIALADFDETATDLADIIVHGTIDRADSFHRTGTRHPSHDDGYARLRSRHYGSTESEV